MKIIFIDLDGTLLGYLVKHTVSDENRKAIFAAKDAGYLIVPCTGRPLEFIANVNDQLDNMFEYAVTNSGGLVFDYKNKSSLHYSPLDKKAVIALCDLAQKHNLSIRADCLKGSFFNIQDSKQNFNQSFYDNIKKQTVLMITLTDNNFDLVKKTSAEVEKIHGVEITNKHKGLDDPNYPRNSYAYIDISPPHTDKGTGIKALCKKLGISPADCISIGDDFNDIPMFRECGYNVAVENALPVLKQSANYITDTNDNDGVAKFLFALLDKRI